MKAEEKAKRRRQIAETVKKKQLTAQEAATLFDVSVPHVRNACKEFNVTTKPADNGSHVNSVKTLRVVKLLMAGFAQVEVARKVGMHRQFVSLIAARASEAGLLRSPGDPEAEELEERRESLEEQVSEAESRLESVRELDEKYGELAEYGAKHSPAEAAKSFGVSITHVYNVMRSYGLMERRQRRPSLIKICRAIARASKGKAPEAISRELKIPEGATTQIVQAAKKAGLFRLVKK